MSWIRLSLSKQHGVAVTFSSKPRTLGCFLSLKDFSWSVSLKWKCLHKKREEKFQAELSRDSCGGGVVWCVPAVGDEPHDAAPSRCSENQMCDARARTGCYQRRFTETSQENCGDVPETNSPHVQNKHTQEPGRYQCYGQLLHCNIEEQLVMLVTNAGAWTTAQGNVFSVPSHNTPNFQSLLNNGFRENCSSHYRASEPGWKGK